MQTTGHNREEAADAALAQHFNKPDTCQLTVRTWLDSPSVGDLDGDGAADAEDGWKSEPIRYRHSDRKPPEGTPVSYLGGSKDNGHRALSLGPINGRWMIRSTDAGGRGIVKTVPLDWPEKEWGLRYVGWSETMDGLYIPNPDATRGWRIDKSVHLIRHAIEITDDKERKAALEKALKSLLSIPKV